MAVQSSAPTRSLMSGTQLLCHDAATCTRIAVATIAAAPTTAAPRGGMHGPQVQPGCRQVREVRDATPQARDARERPERQEGHEPQAGHRDRPQRGAKEGRAGAAQAQFPTPEEERLASREERVAPT